MMEVVSNCQKGQKDEFISSYNSVKRGSRPDRHKKEGELVKVTIPCRHIVTVGGIHPSLQYTCEKRVETNQVKKDFMEGFLSSDHRTSRRKLSSSFSEGLLEEKQNVGTRETLTLFCLVRTKLSQRLISHGRK